VKTPAPSFDSAFNQIGSCEHQNPPARRDWDFQNPTDGGLLAFYTGVGAANGHFTLKCRHGAQVWGTVGTIGMLVDNSGSVDVQVSTLKLTGGGGSSGSFTLSRAAVSCFGSGG